MNRHTSLVAADESDMDEPEIRKRDPEIAGAIRPGTTA